MPTDLRFATLAAPPVASSARLAAAVDNPARLAALDRSRMLDGGPQPTFDCFARLASQVAGAAVALVSVVSDDRQYFAGLTGLPQPWADARETPLSHSFCQHVVANAAPLVIEDARVDPVLSSSPAVVDLKVVAYAGFPIISPGGDVLGSLCAIDETPRSWNAAQLEGLGDIAALVANEIERRELTRRLAIEVRTDALTGIANRRVWDEQLPNAVRLAERLGHSLTVAIIDIDHFKAFNDCHGHAAGDAALREIGRRWGWHVRDTDVLARIGGEEFGLLLPGASTTVAVEIVERLRQDMPTGLTTSAGIAMWTRPLTGQQVLEIADRALYEAKRGGRDRLALASGDGPAAAAGQPDVRRS
jgi:diguanylate cyclase (GGDEF)-like protein